MIVRLLPIEGEHTYSPPHVRLGRVTPIGYTRQPDGSLVFDGAAVDLTLDDEHQSSDLAFLRKEVTQGRIRPGDAQAALVLGGSFAEPQPKKAPAKGEEKL